MNELYAPKELQTKLKILALKTLLYAMPRKKMLENFRINDEVFDFLGVNPKNHKKASEFFDTLDLELKKLEAKRQTSLKALEQNLAMVSDILGLDDTQGKILEFAILLENYSILSSVFRHVDDLNHNAFCIILSKLLDLNLKSVKSALSQSSNLLSSFIIRLFNQGSINMARCFEFLDSDFAANMLVRGISMSDLFNDTIKKCEKSELNESDFSYLKINFKLLKTHLKSAKTGTNVLFYGLPGTGKTEFVKMIAKELNKELFEVSYESYARGYSTSLDGLERFMRLKMADKILSQKQFLMFDEIEDIFRDDKISKALINRTLETNSICTFWITNNISQIDNAYIRRFDMVMEFKNPPKSKRYEILKHYTNEQISDKMAKKLAKNELISPALISNTTKVIQNAKVEQVDEVFKDLITQNLKAQGYVFTKKDKKKNTQIELPKSYDVGFINANLDLKSLALGIKQSQTAKLCIYGVAGTGKSAYAKFIAHTLKRPIIIKKASDLIDCYVGNTEKNIAKAFQEAKDKNAVLVFDEVDTFLQDRGSAMRSWEISQVNEMLTQMESFNGVFIATTNLIDSLDKASLRRFDLKLEFGYLKDTQCVKLFKKECELLGIECEKADINAIKTMPNLAPGDFAAVLGSHKFSPLKSGAEFVTRLKEEVRYKGEMNAKKIGFGG